jgi:hypothetical protein
MSISDAEAGMRGFGRTVFRAREIKEFEVEVLGKTRSMTAGSPVVLVRLIAPELKETGVIAGMSGSPVFLRPGPDAEPRLLGAVAYGFAFSKSPLVGVTPAEDMVKLRQMDVEQIDPEEARQTRAQAWRSLVQAHRDAAEALRSGKADVQTLRRRLLCTMLRLPFRNSPAHGLLPADMPADARELLPDGGKTRMRVLPLPVAISGGSDRGYDAMAPLLRLGGHMPVQTLESGSQSAETAACLEPGMPVGAVWLTGDLELAGMGTVTMLGSNRLVAFGHPMMGTGRTDLPMATGRVEAVISSYRRSFRMASIGQIVGRVTQDRRSGIVGRVGEEAPMFPCVVHVSGDHPKIYRYRAAGYWQVAPVAGFYAAAASTIQWDGRGNPETILGISRISIEGREDPIVLKNLYAGFNPLQPAQDLVLDPLWRLTSNPFRPIKVTGLDVDIQISRGIRLATIESVRLEHDVVQAGETLILWVKLREFRGKEHTRKLELKVPEDARPGTRARVIVSGWRTSQMLDRSLDPGFYEPNDLEGLIRTVRRVPSSTEIYVRAGFLRQGVRYNGEAMPGLPGSVHSMLRHGAENGPAEPLVEDQSTSLDTHWVIEGSVSATINVRKSGAGTELPE